MSHSHQNARSSRREELSPDLRIYGLEGITETQDEAITQLALTTARHDERLTGHDIALAILTEQTSALVKVTATVNATLTKVMWTLIAFAFTIAASSVALVLTGVVGPNAG